MKNQEKKIKEIIINALENQGYNVTATRQGENQIVEILIDGMDYKVQIKDAGLF